MLNEVLAVNFQSWGLLNLTIPTGVLLVDGWNEDDQTSEGSGKSAVLNAVAWAAYGKLPKDTKIDDVIKHGKSGCAVALKFSNGDQIVRTRKPNDLYIKKHSGQDLRGKDATETQKLVEEYLGCNFETFCQSTYFAQNYDKKFLLSNQEDKGKILSGIQNLSIFDKARKEVSDLLKKENDSQITLKTQLQVQESNLKNMDSQVVLIRSFIEDKVKKHKESKGFLMLQHTSIRSKLITQENYIKVLTSSIEDINLDSLLSDELELKKAIVEFSEKLSKLQFEKTQLDTIKKSILTKESEARNIAAKYEKLKIKQHQLLDPDNSTLIRLHAQLKKASEFQQSPSYLRLKSKQSELTNFIANPTKSCPSCGNELKNFDTSHIQKELDGVINELANLSLESAVVLTSVNNEILDFQTKSKVESESIDQELSATLVQLQELSNFLDTNPTPSVESLETSEFHLKMAISQVDVALNKIQQSRLDRSKFENDKTLQLQSMLNLEIQLNEYQRSMDQLGEPDVSQDYAKLGIILNEKISLENSLAQTTILLEQSRTYYHQLDQLKDGFKDIKSYVFNNALKELNYRTNQYLTDLFEVQASIKFSNEDQKIEHTIILDGKEMGLGLLSGGQNKRFNLAVDLALADLVQSRGNNKFGLLILDEPFQNLSENSMAKCIDLIRKVKNRVIIIEHNSIAKTIVDNTFMVRLEGGTSVQEDKV